jgi:hypothetical protein
MALILIHCPNESCNHLGFVSVETLPRVLTCSSCGRRSLHATPPGSTPSEAPIMSPPPTAATAKSLPTHFASDDLTA